MLLSCGQSALADYYWFTTIDVPGAGVTIANAINSSGQIVGYFQDATGYHGFIYTGGTFTAINDPNATEGTFPSGINDEGQIVGHFETATGSQGFLDTGGTFTTFAEGFPSGINDLGQIVGSFCLYSDGTVTPINDPNAGIGGTIPLGINNEGQIVGVFGGGSSGYEGFGFVDTGGTFTTICNRLYGINDSGQIVGREVTTGFLYDRGTFIPD
jgi:probable HAF family extracellular repeat protein